MSVVFKAGQDVRTDNGPGSKRAAPEVAFSGSAQAVALVVAALAALTLLCGWLFSIAFFMRISGGLAAMVPSTAISLLLISCAILVHLRRPAGKAAVTIPTLLTLAATVIALVDLLVILTGQAPGIDSLVFRRSVIFRQESMAAGTALCVMLASTSLFGMAAPRPARWPIVVATGGLLLALVCLFGYAFDVSALYAVPLFSTMSLQTAIAFLLLFLAILLMRPNAGWVGLLSASGSGSTMARRLFPIAVGTPFLLCFAALKASDAGLFTPNFRLGVLAIAMIVLLSVSVLHNAAIENLAEQRLRASMAELDIALADKSLLLREVYHRVKNNLQQINSLIALEERRAEGQQCHAILGSLSARVRALGTVHEMLIRTPQPSQVKARDFLQTLCDDIETGLDLGRRGFTLSATVPDDMVLDIDTAVPIGLLVNEMVTNSVKHAFPQRRQGRIAVDLRAGETPGSLSMTVSDDGVGMDEAVFHAPNGSGSKIILGLVAQLQGAIRVDRVAGTAVVITVAGRAQANDIV